MPYGFDQQALGRFSRHDNIGFQQCCPVIERHIALLLVNTVVAIVTILGEDRADLIFKKFNLRRRELLGMCHRQGEKHQANLHNDD